MISVLNYVSLIEDALTDKLPGFHYCFLLVVEGGAGLQNRKLLTIRNRSKKNEYTFRSPTRDRLLLLFRFVSSRPVEQHFFPTTTARQSDSSEASATGRLLTSGPEYPRVYFEGKAASTLFDYEKMSLLEGKWESSVIRKYTFPSRHTSTACCTIHGRARDNKNFSEQCKKNLKSFGKITASDSLPYRFLCCLLFY